MPAPSPNHCVPSAVVEVQNSVNRALALPQAPIPYLASNHITESSEAVAKSAIEMKAETAESAKAERIGSGIEMKGVTVRAERIVGGSEMKDVTAEIAKAERIGSESAMKDVTAEIARAERIESESAMKDVTAGTTRAERIGSESEDDLIDTMTVRRKAVAAAAAA
jgi:hypothetical protein